MSFLACCVPGCTSKIADGIPLHCFPNPEKDIERFRSWVMNVGGEIIGLDNNFIFKNRRVCRKHFVEQWHYTKNRLCPIAVPTLYLRGATTNVLKPLPSSSTCVDPVPLPCHRTTATLVNQTHATTNVLKPLPSSSTCVDPVPLPCHRTTATLVNQTQIHDNKMTKEEAEMSLTIKKLRRKIQNNRTLQKSFKRRLMLAKNAAKNLDCLTKNLSKSAAAFVKMQISQAGKDKKGRRFTQEQKILALSLYKGSPKQYKVLSEICTLPQRSTLQKLLKKVEVKPGINNFMFENLKKRVAKLPENQKYCVVLFDEMAIATHLDMINGKIEGFVDDGETRKPQLADHALVFMVRGVIKKFKQPVQYTFCSGSTSTIDLKKYIKNVIKNVQYCGLKVVATVCDQGATNMAAINALLRETREVCIRKGEEFTGGYTYINIENEKIYPLYDPPHLMKGIRNNLLNKDLKYTMKKKHGVAKWKHIVDLHEKSPGYRGVRLVPKLTQHHVVPHLIRKMKVKCCTQVFSRTVGVALGFMADAGKLEEAATETADIILFFDNLFDSVNASFDKPKEGKIYKCAVTPTSPHHKLWRESLEILKSMKYVDKSGKTSVVPTLSSWIKTIEGFKMLCSHMYKLGEKSLLLRNINQDPLENFFGAIRAQGHGNTMPTAVNFQAAYKTLLLNNLSSTHSVGANCEKDSNFCLQNLQYLFDIEGSVEPEANFTLLEEHLYLSPIIDDLLKSNLPHDVEKCAAAGYCSGWLVKNAKHKIYKTCLACTSQLESTEKQKFHDLIKISEYSNKTWLCYPSKNVFDAFVHMEYVIMEIMKLMSHNDNIIDYIKFIISVSVNFSFVTCNAHKNELIDFLVKKNVYFCIFNWCKEVNRILCGKATNSDTSDPIKVMAQNYFVKNKTKRK